MSWTLPPSLEDRRVEPLRVAGDVVVVVLARPHLETGPDRGVEHRRRRRADPAADRLALDRVAVDDRAAEPVALRQADLADRLPVAEPLARSDDRPVDRHRRDRDVGAEAVVRTALVVGGPGRDRLHQRSGLGGLLGGERRGHDGEGGDDPCRGLLAGAGPREEQVLHGVTVPGTSSLRPFLAGLTPTTSPLLLV